jgi:iron complex outermembrane receptor protein
MDLIGAFDTGWIKHHVAVGYEYDYFRSKTDNFAIGDEFSTTNFFGFTIPTGASSPINVFSPNYSLPQPTDLPGSINAIVTQLDNAVYAQDEIEITKKFRILTGVRYDVVQQDYQQQTTLFAAGNLITNNDLADSLHSYYASPRIALLYQPIEEVLSFYGNYSASFEPAQSGIFLPGTQLRPEVGRSGEGGMKLDLLDKHLSLSATGFYVVQDNVVTQINQTFSEQIGRQRSQGAQLSAVGKLTDQWSVIANYAYIDSRILDAGLLSEVGQRFRGVPFNSANLWSRYNLLQDERRTFGVALGMVYVGERPGDLIDSFALGSYVRWDGGVYYQRGVLNASLYLENIGDRTYYAGSLNNLSVYPGNPFTLRAQLGVKF